MSRITKNAPLNYTFRDAPTCLELAICEVCGPTRGRMAQIETGLLNTETFLIILVYGASRHESASEPNGTGAHRINYTLALHKPAQTG